MQVMLLQLLLKLLPPQTLVLVVQGHQLRLLLQVVQGLGAGDGVAAHEQRLLLLLLLKLLVEDRVG